MSADNYRPIAGWDQLRLRAGLLNRLREFFEERSFLEVETPLMSADVVVDRHLDPLSVLLPDDPRFPECGRRMWLQTSPEFGMKRLMASGGQAIYQVTRAFRAGESGELHNPEFTIVEWYRRDDSMQDGMQLLSDLTATLLGTGSALCVSYEAAFEEYVHINPHRCSMTDLRQVSKKHGLSLPDALSEDRDAWLNLLLTEKVEPQLGTDGATILFDYPASQAALATIRADDPPVAERFELYVRGVELANGYHELIDPDELQQRNRQANVARNADGKYSLPEKSQLLAAMQQGLPRCTGVALGWDRLVMLAVGASSISQVMTFPVDRA